jgi:hypothetical protein
MYFANGIMAPGRVSDDCGRDRFMLASDRDEQSFAACDALARVDDSFSSKRELL